ncbi:bifunctional diaminohydroxyphosphoribosylaminopyrimidine deaminase/5-amino-6-(5-phosphoribosylamino)uracil reductase RibD [Zavarzinella formosa]|uniref:bifunctional diaminohydroxyphosphoribosylaminopyrimidine deaminase/5-amino-6-(5-phosphoribosylamino)uracil reductase RibD n=1 Tax=Zavarzinella formosa TaxID=360055 RepID=UPI00030ECD74|nr:bifunctional diaminohydroxyphosphoribosylaminopyrimidine deaminase/5-amino-6-(5-phosphoribosylamino)uracil reductase RibD [Zavarzinella formosa]
MTDLEHMQRALALADRGRGFVEPNPMVGAVVVRDGLVVGEGWHERYGQAHAEVNALRMAGEAARGSTLYVTLEPCCHFGKTPPCTDLVIRSGVRRVVAAMLDPFPQVAGQGAARLREAGITFEVGVGELAARGLNAPYLKRLRGKSWVVAKWAMTLDGKIATASGESKWITGAIARQRVHEIRGKMDAILVGRGTLIADDPLLTARPAGARTPARIVMTTTGEGMDRSFKLLETIQEAPVMVAAPPEVFPRLHNWKSAGAELLPVRTVMELLELLATKRMTNLLVEGGSGVLGSFLAADEIDEVFAFVAPKLFGGFAAPSPIGRSGISSIQDCLILTDIKTEILGDDLLIHGRKS